jgi:TPP-dependent trihydroxycyclohexane-1,2-dione (THcHDO) dehydratase
MVQRIPAAVMVQRVTNPVLNQVHQVTNPKLNPIIVQEATQPVSHPCQTPNQVTCIRTMESYNRRGAITLQ